MVKKIKKFIIFTDCRSKFIYRPFYFWIFPVGKDHVFKKPDSVMFWDEWGQYHLRIGFLWMIIGVIYVHGTKCKISPMLVEGSHNKLWVPFKRWI